MELARLVIYLLRLGVFDLFYGVDSNCGFDCVDLFGGPLLQTKTPPHRKALACKCVPAVGGGINARFICGTSDCEYVFGALGEVLTLSAFPAPTCIRKMPRAILRASKNNVSLTFSSCRPLVTVMNPFPRVLMNFL